MGDFEWNRAEGAQQREDWIRDQVADDVVQDQAKQGIGRIGRYEASYNRFCISLNFTIDLENTDDGGGGGMLCFGAGLFVRFTSKSPPALALADRS